MFLGILLVFILPQNWINMIAPVIFVITTIGKFKVTVAKGLVR
ncbi:hypothetical protein [Spiroplasma kunkelii]|nr:hypothetical protein [Spiroplasma kunkelii]